MIHLLDDDELRHAAGGWEAPPLGLRKNLHPHDIVQLLFRTPDGVGSEAMWVEILRTGPWGYEGILLNAPVWLRNVQRGDRVNFEVRHITDILPPGSKAWSPGLGASLWDPFRPEEEKEEEPKEPPQPPPPPSPEIPRLPGAAPHKEPVPTPRVFYLPYLGPVAEHPPPKGKWYETFGPAPPPESKEIIVRPSGEIVPAVPPPSQLPGKYVPKAFEVFKPKEPPPTLPAKAPPPPGADWVESVVPPEEQIRARLEEPPKDIWDALVPEEAKKEAPELAPEDLFAPTKEEQKRKRKTRAKEPPAPRLPSEEEILDALNERFELQLMVEDARLHRDSAAFQRAVEDSAMTGEAAIVPLAGLGLMSPDPGWIMEFADLMGAPEDEWGPWVNFLESEEDSEEAWEAFMDKVFHPITTRAMNAFERIKPKELPGKIVIDTSWDEVLLGYWEPPSEESVKGAQSKATELEAKAKKEYDDRRLRLEEKLQRWEKPSKKDLEAFVSEELDLDKFFDKIKKARKRPRWKRELKEEGEAALELEKIGDADEYIPGDFGEYMGFPKHVGEAYMEEDLVKDFFHEVFIPVAELLEEVIEEQTPESIPGTIGIRKDPMGETFALMYIED